MNTAGNGFVIPSLQTLAEYHPQVALAVWSGVPLRPNLRPLSVELQNSQVGNPQRSSFDTVISQYSIFGGCAITIDPTNNLAANPLKYISDATQPATSGVTVTLLVKSNDGTDYSPIPDETPLQSVPTLFAPSIGSWRLVNPENVKAAFTLQTPQSGDHFTVWLTFCFFVLASSGTNFFNISIEDARNRLRAIGLLPPPGPSMTAGPPAAGPSVPLGR